MTFGGEARVDFFVFVSSKPQCKSDPSARQGMEYDRATKPKVP
jgi:hypothetical protein